MASDERRQIEIVVSSIEGVSAQAVKRITLNCTAALIAPPTEGGTPIDTRWASSNWVPKIGDTFTGLTGTAPSEGQPARPDFGAQQQGIAEVVTGYTLSRGIVTITNNVPYILALNEGSSKQAPAGFVQAAILRAIQGVKL